MSTEVVKKQLLVSITALNLPLDSSPSSRKVGEACAAAKLLRNRLLREHARVLEFIENLRQKQIYDEDSEEEENDDAFFGNAAEGTLSKNSRAEFVFLAEMMIVEKLVVPLLLAHGMKYSESLLPQLLKLLAAMLQPIPRFSADETTQRDLLKRIKQRCGTDEFFALLVQSVAPIAEKRATGSLHREDVVLLEVVLSLITLLLDGRPQDVESVIGAFCRNHGIELLLVVINQNYSKIQQKSEALQEAAEQPAGQNEETPDDVDTDRTEKEGAHTQISAIILDDFEEENQNTLAPTLVFNETSTQSNIDKGSSLTEEVVLSTTQSAAREAKFTLDDDEEEFEEGSEEEDEDQLEIQDPNLEMERQFEEKVLSLLESDEQLWKWNCLAMTSIANVFNCVFPVELAQLSFLGQMNVSSPDQLLNLLRGGSHFRDCKREADNWRFIARSRNGAMNSNSVLVRLDPENRPGTVGGRAIGTVSSLFGTRRKDPLENIKDMDLRKRGRFVKGMFQDSTPRCDLPLPTKILLSQQSQSFLCFGFEPLTTMTWQRIQGISQNTERAAKEYKETVSGFKNSGERMEITSPLSAELYQEFAHVLRYMTICGNLLHYIREVARLMKQDGVPYTSQQFQQQWQSVSSIISLDHLEGGFAVLRSFLQCRDLRRRCDVLDVVNYLAELLFMLNLILEKEVVDDPAVDIAAHALASSVLYKEENIKTVFDLLNEYATRNLSISKSQSLTLFVFAVFQLMERCSYNGSLLLPKRPKRKGTMTEAGDDGLIEDDDKESVNSAILEEMEREMVEQMADMIDDDDSDASNDSSSGSSHSDADATPQTPKADGGHLQSGEPLAFTTDMSPETAAGAIDAAARSSGDAAALSSLPTHDAGGIPPINLTNGEGHQPPSRATSSTRAPSEAHPPSIASLSSSGRTALSTISSEREVAVGSYLRRLATTKNVGLLYSALRHWRINDADVNLGLTYLMERLTREGCESVFFNIAFLLLFRDVIVNGKRTHKPLYNICDRLVYDFFNPGFAHALDFRTKNLFDERDVNVLTGSQSFLGFEVALRCGRSLFNFAAGDYDVLEEKAMPHLMDYTAVPTAEEDEERGFAQTLTDANITLTSYADDHHQAPPSGFAEVTEDMVREEREEPKRKRRRRQRDPAGRGADASGDMEAAATFTPEEEGHGAFGDAERKGKKERKEKKEKKRRAPGEKRKKERKVRGPQPPASEPTGADAAAEEEDKLFQALMAAIAPTPSLSSTTAAPKEFSAQAIEDDDEAILLR